MDLLKNSCNLKGSLVFPPYCWPDGVKVFYESRNIQIGWKYYQGVIHNTYHGGNIETYHVVICSMLEDVTKHFAFHNFTTPGKGTLKEVIDNDTTPRDKISLIELVMTKGKS